MTNYNKPLKWIGGLMVVSAITGCVPVLALLTGLGAGLLVAKGIQNTPPNKYI